MPQFDYQHPDGRIITLYQGMNEQHEYKDEDGVKWKRLFSIPNSVIDSIYSINPYNSKEFVNVTSKKKGSVGDLFQLSAELSEKRKNKDGFDKIENKSFDKYEKDRVIGTIHPLRRKKQLKEAIGKSRHFEIVD